MIQVFNRSYYEDIIVPSVNKVLTEKQIEHRCSLINEIEQHLMQNNIHVLKFFLHISKKEQEERIKERLKKPHKRWKYSIEDDRAAESWHEYAGVYDKLMGQCNNIPWHIIPSDKRWYRNYLVAKILTEHLEELNLKYPNSQKNINYGTSA